MDYTFLADHFKKELKAQLDYELEPQFLPAFENLLLSQSKIGLNRQVVTLMCAALELDEFTQEGKSVKSSLPMLPGLIIYACGAIGAEPERAIPAAAAVEFLLRASCLLDDIQDQDRPEALAAKLGVAKAQNIALIMIELGQANLVSALRGAGLPADLCLDLLYELSRTVITATKGQLLDLLEIDLTPQQQFNDPGYFLQKAGLKTAATIGFLTHLGALIGAGNETEATGLYRDFGLSFGMVLHLINDLKDFVLGLENTGRDLKRRHLTLPVIYAYHELSSQEDQAAFLEMWSNPGSSEDVHWKLLDQLRNSFVIPQVLAQASHYMAQAESILKLIDSDLQKSEHQIMLASLKELLSQFYNYFKRFNGLKP